jgi:deferrochelatase/peroxidase EfeB
MSSDGKAAPIVRRTEAAYRNRNAAPDVESLTAMAPAEVLARAASGSTNVFETQSPDEKGIFTGLEESKAEGAPLSGGGEFSQPDFNLVGSEREPILAADAHVRLVHPSNNDGAKMLRRGYNFVDGSDGLGRMDAGLLFLAYVRDPRTQFIPIQTKLGLGDRLSEYVQHTGSALFAIPPGIAQGEHVGQALFA